MKNISYFGKKVINKKITKNIILLCKNIIKMSLLPKCIINISFISKKDMIKINYKWKNVNSTTDILSFNPSSRNLILNNLLFLGDIIICLDKVKIQAKKLNHSISDEIGVLIIHGILHLVGLDHEKNQQSFLEQVEYELAIIDLINLNPSLSLISRTFFDN